MSIKHRETQSAKLPKPSPNRISPGNGVIGQNASVLGGVQSPATEGGGKVFGAEESQVTEFTRLLQEHRPRLKRLVEMRLDPRMRGRLDASDVIQDTQIEAFRRAEEYLADQSVPLFVWLRFLTLQKLAQLHRQHLGTKVRDVSREVSLERGFIPATSAALAAQLVGQLTTASQAAERAEAKARLENALNEMEANDREVLTLRHFEQLSQKETALVLGITEKATGSRHIRALARLRKKLADVARP